LNYCFENEQIIKSKGKELMKINRDKFTLNQMTKQLDEIINKYIENKPQQVGLQLPKLKKINKGESDSPKLKLPKLKKKTTEANV
jgi:septum formation topological specificity factor MinE